jgi:hypothetical protein
MVHLIWLVARSPLPTKENQALMDDLPANVNFLFSRGQPIIEKRPAIHPFDYASVQILFGNIYYRFTRGRGELNVTLAPRHSPSRTHELSQVIAALDSARIKPIGNDCASIASALAPRLADLDQAFAENAFPKIERNLP